LSLYAVTHIKTYFEYSIQFEIEARIKSIPDTDCFSDISEQHSSTNQPTSKDAFLKADAISRCD